MSRLLARGWLAPVALLAIAATGWAETKATPVQANGGGASGDEYVRKSDLGFQWSGSAVQQLEFRDSNVAALGNAGVVRTLWRTQVLLGAEGQFGSKAWWGFRLGTNTGNPVSRKIVLAGGDANGGGGAVGIDRIYVGFQPHSKVKLTLGKDSVNRSYWASEALLDRDLTLPGATVRWDIFQGGDEDVLSNVSNTLGYYFVRDVVGNASDPFAVFEQLKGDIGPVTCAVGLYHFNNLNVAGAGVPFGLNTGNALTLGGALVDRQITTVAGKAEYPFSVGTFPLEIGGEVWANVERGSQHVGWELQLRAPKLGQGRARLTYRNIGSESTFSSFSDSDFGQGTGTKSGIEAYYAHPITSNVEFSARFLRWDTFQPNNGFVNAPSVNRLQFDVNAKF